MNGLVRLSLLLAGMAVAGACSSAPKPGPDSVAPAAPSGASGGAGAAQAPTAPAPPLTGTGLTPVAGTPKKGGVMVITPSESPKTMDPYLSSGVTMNHVGRPVYQTLNEVLQPTPAFDPRGSGDVEPLLAEKWDMPNDTTIIFHLRKGVKFHNGDEMTADDVIWSFEYANDAKNAFSARTNFRLVKSMEKVDPYTVKITMTQVDPDALRRLSSSNYILPKKFIESGGDIKKMAVGTGPFRQIRFDSAKESLSVKFDDYWDKGKPHLDGIQHFFGLERTAILAGFSTRKIDFYNVTDKVQFDEFKRQVPDLKHYVFHTDYNYGWYPNITKAPLNDPRVRKAMQLVIDRDAVNDSVAFGLGKISAPGDAGFLQEAGLTDDQLRQLPGWRKPKEQDIAQAKKLMQEAGFANGFKLRGLYINTYTTVPQIAELTANQFKTALNIDLELVGLDTALWSDAVDKKGDFDLAMGNTRITSSPDTNLTNYWSSKGAFNKGGINDPALDELITKQKSIIDSAQRKKVWAEISKIITEKDYYLPTLDGAYFAVMQPWVNNIYSNYSAQPWLRKPADVWFNVETMPQERVKAPRQ